MELVDGLPLDKYAADHQLSIRGRLELMAHLADAVDYAHRQGVIHRDLKPANILVGPSGRPKILDFGIARLHGIAKGVASDHLEGTIPYMSPEQTFGGSRSLAPASDVYALGVIVYELFANRLPVLAGRPIRR